MLVASLIVTIAPAHASATSAGCQAAINGELDAWFWAGSTDLGFDAGDTLVIQGNSFVQNESVYVYGNGVLLASQPFVNGDIAVSVTFTADTTGRILWSTGAGSSNRVSWTLDCVPTERIDTDDDGVLDDDDLCPGTIDDAPTKGTKRNRLAASLADGGLVDAEGALGATFAETAGCSGQQIIEALGLGVGHEKFGISRSALDTWITLQS